MPIAGHYNKTTAGLQIQLSPYTAFLGDFCTIVSLIIAVALLGQIQTFVPRQDQLYTSQYCWKKTATSYGCAKTMRKSLNRCKIHLLLLLKPWSPVYWPDRLLLKTFYKAKTGLLRLKSDSDYIIGHYHTLISDTFFSVSKLK